MNATRCGIVTALVVCGVLGFHAEAPAAVFDVGTPEEFSNAVWTAQSNSEHDVINVSAGTHHMPWEVRYDSTEAYSLTIAGAGGAAILDADSGCRILYVYQRANSTNAFVRFKDIHFVDGFVSADFGGGALIRTQRGDITFEDCEFEHCRSLALFVSSQAGGLFAKIENEGSFIFTRTRFNINEAKGIGGGAYVRGGSGSGLVMRNCVFTGNNGSTSGGGASVDLLDGAMLFENNTFYGNMTGVGNGGGALYLSMHFDAGTIDLRNNVTWSNSAQNSLGCDVYVQDDNDGNGTGAVLRVERNCYSDIDWADGDHRTFTSNVTANPLLRSDLMLKGQSPCVDKGTNADWMAGAEDAAGNDRIVGGVVDMGAYECVFTNRKPAIDWTATAGATKYELWVTRNGTKYSSSWLAADPTEWTFTSDLPGGDYSWWVRPWSNSTVLGAWSGEAYFVVPVLAPGAVALLSPVGDVETNRPAFAWFPDDKGGATYYQLLINKGGTKYFSTWVVGATNYATTSSVPYGVYQWWVRGWSPDGYGAWSSPTGFTRGVVVPLAPTGTVTGVRSPAFTWTPVSGATWYKLYLQRNGSFLTQTWVQAATNWTCPADFKNGNYRWWALAYSASGKGPWSAPADFRIPYAVPTNIVLVSPTGTVAGASQDYTWQADAAATYYRLLIYRNGAPWYSQWYKTGITNGNVVQSVPGHTLGTPYTWWVRGWCPDGYGPWSSAAAFTPQ